jgi:N-acyl homoserine lactone hydrolase
LAAQAPNYTLPEWIDFTDADYVVTNGDIRVASGIRIVSTPGHTPGHQSLVVDTKDGVLALAGQAVYSCAQYEQTAQHGDVPLDDLPDDPDSYVASARRLIELRPTRVHFSHDRAVWNADRESPIRTPVD